MSGGKVLIRKDYSKEWGKKIKQVRIMGTTSDINSSSDGVVTAIDSSVGERLVVGVESANFIFIYDNLKSSDCFIGQKLTEGQVVGNLEKGEYLLLRVKKDNEYIDPRKILRCKIAMEK